MEEPRPDFESEQTPTATPSIACPQCGQAVDPSTVTGAVAQCPACGLQFFPPAADSSEEPSDEQKEEEQARDARRDELSALKIRQFSVLMRTAYRTRSYLIVATIGCLWVIPPLLVFAWEYLHERHRINIWSVLYFLLAIAAWYGAIKFGRRIIEVQREINATRRSRELQEAEAARHEPDLSTLSDGSQHARNLEQMFTSTVPPRYSGTAPDGHGPEA